MASADEVRALLDAFATGNATQLGSSLADDFTFSGPVPVPLNKQQFIGLSQAIAAGVPNWSFNISDIQIQGDSAVVTVAVSGDQTGTLENVIPGVPPIPPTGKHFQLPTEHITTTFRGQQVASVRVDPVPGGGIPGMYAQIGHPLPMPPNAP